MGLSGKQRTHKKKSVGLTFLVILLLFQVFREWQQERMADYGKHAGSGEIVCEVGVDPRVELVSVIFRLAGNPEYNQCSSARYKRDVRKHFGRYADQAVVQEARRLRETRWVGHDVPMGLAVHLADGNHLDQTQPLGEQSPGLDNHWGDDGGRQFIEQVYSFSRQSDFSRFFADHRRLYDKTSARLRGLLGRDSHFEWFDEFFGPRSGVRFRIVPGMLTGVNNYGVHAKTDGRETYYCILGVWHCGFLGWGSPRFSKTMVPVVIHEFCHSYCNPLVDVHMSELEQPARRIASQLEAAGRCVPYGNWQPILYESVVRACVISYLKARTGERAARSQLRSDVRMGFLWLPELCELLDQYEAGRDRYPTFESFFPRIVEFIAEYEPGRTEPGS